jgi:hypothetical protein
MEANSTPITPPPRMTAESGTRSRLSAWSEVMMRPEISRPRVFEKDPDARTTLLPR